MVAHPDRPSTSLCLLVKFAQRLRIVQVVRLAVSASGAACRASAVVTRFIPCSCPTPPNPFVLLPYLRFPCSALVWFFNLRPVQFALFVLSQAHNLLFFPSSVFVGIWKLKKGRVQSGTHAALCRYGCPGFCFCCRCCCCRGCCRGCGCGCGWRCKVHAAIARHLALD